MTQTLDMAVIGAGSRGLWTIGHEFVRRVGEARVLSFCDPRDDLRKNADWVRQDVSEKIAPVDYDIATCADIADVLADDRIRMVFLATPDHLHVEYAERILDSGHDLLIEKPMATTVDGLNRIVAAQERSGQKVFVGFCMRYNPLHNRAKQRVAAGDIGRPCAISFQDYYAMGRGYFRSRGRFREFTGGLLAEKACHSFDLMSWILGADPTRVSCFGRVNVFKPREDAAMHCRDCDLTDTCFDAVQNKQTDPYGHVRHTGNDLCVYNSEKDNDDTDGLLIDFESGAIGTYLEVFYSPNVERRYSIVGTEGELLASEEFGTIRVRRLGEAEWHEEKIDYPPGGHRGADPLMVTAALDYFLERTDDDRTVGAHAGRSSVLVALGAQQAADEERIVHLSEMTGGS